MTIENVLEDIQAVCQMKNLSLQSYTSNDKEIRAFIIYKNGIGNEIYVTKNNSNFASIVWQLWTTKNQKDNFKYRPTNIEDATLYCSYGGIDEGLKPLKQDILKLIDSYFVQPKRLTIFNFIEE